MIGAYDELYLESARRVLADKSGVPVRTIQQYEQRLKDIQKAQGITLVRLAKALGCWVEDIT